MPTQTTDLFLFEDLEDAGKTSELAESDLDAVHAVAPEPEGRVSSDCPDEDRTKQRLATRLPSADRGLGHARGEALPLTQSFAQSSRG
jgi:hypothetical protein